MACKKTTEENANADLCKRGIQLYDATLTAIGWGVGCLAKVDKNKLFRDKNILINDMNVVYEDRTFDPKKTPKLPLLTLLGSQNHDQKLDWMKSTEWLQEKHRNRILLG